MTYSGFRNRPDITGDLVHFIKGDTVDESVAILKMILADGCLIGGNGFIKGDYRCVCFSEAPLEHLADAVIRMARMRTTYQPVGILAPKTWVFAMGGRSVIYGPSNEFEELPEHLRWRHVRYEPLREEPVDWTWEREWRVHTEELKLQPDIVRLVLPTVSVFDDLVHWHDAREEDRVGGWRQVLDDQHVDMMKTSFPWSPIVLDQQS